MGSVRRCRCGAPPAVVCDRPGKSFVLCKRCATGRRVRDLILAHGYRIARAEEQEYRV